MQDANALMARLYRFFRYVDDAAAFQGLAIFLDEKLGLFLWPKIVVVLAYQASAFGQPSKSSPARLNRTNRNDWLSLMNNMRGMFSMIASRNALAALSSSSMRLRSLMSRTNACQRPSGRMLALTSTGTSVPSFRS